MAQVTPKNNTILLSFCYRSSNHPNYVDLLKSSNKRAIIIKLRIRAHKLAIEGGRYIIIPRNQRVCSICDSCELEDEEHFLLKCSLYNQLRQVFGSKIKNIQNQRPNLKTVLDNPNRCILKLSSHFIGNSLKLRENVVS